MLTLPGIHPLISQLSFLVPHRIASNESSSVIGSDPLDLNRRWEAGLEGPSLSPPNLTIDAADGARLAQAEAAVHPTPDCDDSHLPKTLDRTSQLLIRSRSLNRLDRARGLELSAISKDYE